MAIYGSYLTESNSVREFKLDDLNSLRESYADVCVAIVENGDEYIEEGANVEMMRTLRASRKAFKAASKECRAAIKSKDKKTAKSKINEMKKIVKDGKNAIDDIESTSGSMILGYFAQYVVKAARNIVWSIGINILDDGTGETQIQGDGNGGFQYIQGNPSSRAQAAELITKIKTLFARIRKIYVIIENARDSDNMADALNMFKVEIKICYQDLELSIKILEKVVDNIKD